MGLCARDLRTGLVYGVFDGDNCPNDNDDCLCDNELSSRMSY